MIEDQLVTLEKIGAQTGNSDKCAWHHGYTATYEHMFAPLRDAPVRLLEIGVESGKSISMWDKYFDHPDTIIVGVDINLWCDISPSPRVKLFLVDATDEVSLLGAVSKTAPFDIVIDDGSHEIADQKKSFRSLWPLVAPGGYYIIEDLHHYFRENRWGTSEWLFDWARSVIGQYDQRDNITDIFTAVESLSFYKLMCVFKKKATWTS